MIEALGYLWLRPWWILLVPVAIILGAFLMQRAVRLGAWERAVDSHLLDAMRRMGRIVPGRTERTWWPAAVLGVIGLALAGPASERRDNTSYRNLDAVVLVLDLSPSVTEHSRLFDVLTAARLVAEAADTRQTAAVVYAGEAYVAAPLSTDARALSGTLALLDADTMPVGGTRPETGLAMARQIVIDAKIIAADIVLLSDGNAIGPEALAQAGLLAEVGATLSAIVVPGDAAGGAALDALVRTGTGTMGTLSDPYPVLSQLAASPALRLAETGFATLVLTDLGRYLLLLALVPAFLLLPRRRLP
ncbi:MAG: vWA domain-containing protein [Pseudomonadota bacterium]